MSVPPNQYPGSVFTHGVVTENGQDKQPHPVPIGAYAVHLPGFHSPNIQTKELSRTAVLVPPTIFDQCSTNFPPDPGTGIVQVRTTGGLSERATCFMYSEQNLQSSMPGNSPIMEVVNRLAQEKLQKNRVKGVKKSSRDGAEIKLPNDGQDWFHDLTKGIATHAATPPLAGTILQEIKNIDTAIQQFAASLSGSGALGALGSIGSMLNLGSMISGMSSSQRQEATKNMPPEVVMALDSMANLVSYDEGTSMSACAGKVNANTFMTNTISLLSQVDNVADLEEVFYRLTTDTSLHGDPGTATITTSTPYGNMTFIVNASGDLDFDDADSNVSVSSLSTLYDVQSNSYSQVANTINKKASSSSSSGNSQTLQKILQVGNALMSAASNPGLDNKINMFGDQAAKIQEMVGRLATQAQSEHMKTMSKAMGAAAPLGALKQVARIGGKVGELGLKGIPAGQGLGSILSSVKSVVS